MNNLVLTIKRNNLKAVPFEELDIGEVFTDLNLEQIFMKIELVEAPDRYSILKNAIDLKTGMTYRFYHGNEVFQLKVTLMED